MSSLTKVDLTVCEVTRSAIEKAKRTLESATSQEHDREWAIEDLEDIYTSAPEKRTAYHYAYACYLLSIHSRKGVKELKVYANKCLAEAKRKLYVIKVDAEDSTFKDEFFFTEQIFKDLQKKATIAMDTITAETRRLRLENNLPDSPSPRKVQARLVKMKKQKVSWGRDALGRFGDDDDESDEGDDYRDEDYEEPDRYAGKKGKGIKKYDSGMGYSSSP